MKGADGFIPGKTLAGELSAAMERVKAHGVTYPEGYHRTLTAKYEKEGVRYPHILTILGKPRINDHFFYSNALGRNGRLLDYGCGTADNVRQLIRDGFSRDRITAFDIDRESIDLGFNLYRDQDTLKGLFVVSEEFPFSQEEFDTIYSASVIHVIAGEQDFKKYLANAYAALRPGGVLFGSTLGLAEGAVRSPGARGPPRIMTREQLAGELAATGFGIPEIVRRYGVPGYIPHSEDLCILEFCTKKQDF